MKSKTNQIQKVELDNVQKDTLQYAELLGIPISWFNNFLRRDTDGPVYTKQDQDWINSGGKKCITRVRQSFINSDSRKPSRSKYVPLDLEFDIRDLIYINPKATKKIAILSFTREHYLSQFPSGHSTVPNMAKKSKSKSKKTAHFDIPLSAPNNDKEYCDPPVKIVQNDMVDGILVDFRIPLRIGKNGTGSTGPPFNVATTMVPRGTNKNGIYHDIITVTIPVPLEGLDLCLRHVAKVTSNKRSMIVTVPTGKDGYCSLITKVNKQLAADISRFGDQAQARDGAFNTLREMLRARAHPHYTICLDYPDDVEVTLEEFQGDVRQTEPLGLTAEAVAHRQELKNSYGKLESNSGCWAFVVALKGRRDIGRKMKSSPNPMALIARKNRERMQVKIDSSSEDDDYDNEDSIDESSGESSGKVDDDFVSQIGSMGLNDSEGKQTFLRLKICNQQTCNYLL